MPDLPQGQALLDGIQRLRRELDAVILAHYYQDAEIQDLADFVGDSLQLSQQAANTLSLAANAAEILRGIGVASPTDYLTATASATGGGAAGPVLGVGGSDAVIDLLFNTKGASSRYVWQINGVTKMDFTDVGGGSFALRNMSGELRTNAGKLNDNFVAWNSDCGVARVAAKVVSVSDGSQNANGWLADAGRRRVSAQFDVASNATPANVPESTASFGPLIVTRVMPPAGIMRPAEFCWKRAPNVFA